MAGLLNGKQLMDKTVSARKLAETYLPVEGGTITGDLTVTGNTTLSDKAMYKGSEIANQDDLYDDTGVKELINELEQKKQDKLTAGDHITLSDSDVIGVDYGGLQDQLLQDQFIKTDSLSDYYTKPQVDNIIDNLDVDHAITADRLTTPRTINGVEFDGTKNITFHSLYSKRIEENSNLNDYTQAGMYYCPRNIDVQTIDNTPVNEAFSLLVEKHAGVKQTFTTFSETTPRIYIRNYYYDGTFGEGWGKWYQIYTEFSPPTDLTVSSLKQTGLYTTYFDLDLRSKISSQWAYTKKVLLLHPLDADIYPGAFEGRHSVQGEFYINRYNNTSAAGGTTIKVDSCTGYSFEWKQYPAFSVLNSGGNTFTSVNLNNEENTISFCECLYGGVLYRGIYFSGIQRVEYVGFSGKVYNIDDNFGRVTEYYQFYSASLNQPVSEILNEEIYNSIELKDDRHIEQHIQVGSSSIYGDLVVGRKKSATDGKAGVYINSAGGIEICNATAPYIDFHYANSTEDYTSRIAAIGDKVLGISGSLNVGVISEGSAVPDYSLYVNGTGKINGDLGVANDLNVGGSLVQTGLYTTYFDLDLRSKIISSRAYTKKVLLLHPLDADLYPAALEGRHSVQGEFYINRCYPLNGAGGMTLKVDSCTGYSSSWGTIPSLTVLNSGSNTFTSSNLNNQENTLSFCECVYEGIPYRAVYFSGNQVVDYVGFSGKVYNVDDNFGRVVEYYRFYNYIPSEPVDEILNEEIYESIELKDDRHIEQHIQVGSSSIYGGLMVGRKKSATDGKAGIYINSAGGIEICNATAPYIDFHYANSTEDYTSRISETAKGKLTVSNDLIVNKDLTVNGLTSFSQRPTVNGVQLATVEDIAALRNLLAGDV